MKALQRTLSVLLAVCLLLGCAPLVMADSPTFSDPDAAAAYVRKGLLQREKEIPFVYLAPSAAIGELNSTNLKAYFRAVWEKIDAAAVAHTGVSNEGDYLEKHLNQIGYSYSLSYAPGASDIRYQVTAVATYHTTAAQETRVAAAVAAALQELNLSGKSDYEKARTINDYICGKVEYDYENLNDDSYDLKYSAYAALINGTAVCQGYATLFYRMALEAGLDCRVISGMGDNGESVGPHAWNIVKISGKYYYMDVTWNDGSRSDNYCLKGKDGFQDHYPNDEYLTRAFTDQYPIADTAYDPGQEPVPCRHQAVVDAAVPADCTHTGLTAGSHCALCGEILVPQTVVAVAGHSWDNGNITRPATCKEAGERTHKDRTCPRRSRQPRRLRHGDRRRETRHRNGGGLHRRRRLQGLRTDSAAGRCHPRDRQTPHGS